MTWIDLFMAVVICIAAIGAYYSLWTSRISFWIKVNISTFYLGGLLHTIAAFTGGRVP